MTVHGIVLHPVELWRCQYPRRCRQTGCRARATVIVGYVDGQGRPLRQLELCGWYVGELPKGGIAVCDMR
jgi:hypothetical protein